ncbi:general amino acid permease AGP2 [Crepidotus variabilis]|uniref:General amino acid permease AGP2 n=1 Tax=Crepidotus variabilis TaxID=179855 RepID=A0A9P6E8T0_9AGAR|nr:general amino acid permease AGP2 [Crepidotus variabilis]
MLDNDKSDEKIVEKLVAPTDERSIVATSEGEGGFHEDISSADALQFDHTHRNLKNRHVQLIGIGGAIGTVLFVQIGATLSKGGPGSLFIAFSLWCTVIIAITNCISEMVTWIPISSPFIRFADRFVDPALGFCAGVNFFLFQAMLVPFEIVAFNVVLKFWTDQIPTAAVIAFVLFMYAMLNFFAVKYYGESEFWLAIGKAILIIGLIVFTFVTMCGGNPQRDVYGFRNWNSSKVTGTPFAPYIYDGALGQFVGFLACLIQAAWTIAGPEYVSMAAGEAQTPRHTMPKAFNSVIYRLTFFFVFGTLSVGIILAYNDPDLLNAISNAHPGAGSSPYVIAMVHMRIPVLPHIVNALILTSIFSAGNSYAFCASRALLGLSLEGKVPKVFSKCTKNGVPIYSVMVTLAIGLLAFLQLSNDAAVVLQWITSLVTASEVINFAIIAFSYIQFYKGLKAQGISRDTLPYKARWQPYSAYYAFIATATMTFLAGYTVFLPGHWSIPDFFFSYAMVGALPLLFVYYKLRHRSQWQTPETMSFFEKERAQVDRYERELKDNATTKS